MTVCLHPAWRRTRNPSGNSYYVCTDCGRVQRQQPSTASGGTRFTVNDLGMLRMAKSWGLLRDQAGRRFMLTGAVSLGIVDLRALITSCRGQLDAGADMLDGTVDVLILGEEANPKIIQVATDLYIPMVDEAGLLAMLIPSRDELLAYQDEATQSGPPVLASSTTPAPSALPPPPPF